MAAILQYIQQLLITFYSAYSSMNDYKPRSATIFGSTIFPIIEWTKESNSEYEINNNIRFILDFCWARS